MLYFLHITQVDLISISTGDYINSDAVLKLLDKIKALTLKTNINLYQRRDTKLQLILLKAGAILNKILGKLELELKRIQSKNYCIGYGEKTLAIDFLVYVMQTRPALCLSDFEEQDRKEVLNDIKETIKKFKPVMNIIVYHRGQDFFEIPRLVKTLSQNINYIS
jgi:hypothetical protein